MKKTRRTTEQIIRILRDSEGLSVDEVCRWLGLNRSTLRYTPKPVPDKTKLLEAEIVKMSKRYPCFDIMR